MRPGCRRAWRSAACVLTVLAAGAMASCTAGGKSGGSPTAGAAGSSPSGLVGAVNCGIAHTAAGVPVQIEIGRGPVGCSTAMAVERDYARAIASGKVAGNGGGAPVTVRGWVCQGYNTPEVLATGHTSSCKRDGTEILAVLAPGKPSASPSS